MGAQALSLFGRLDRPASAVLFAGLGGACEGIRQATGVSPLTAVNHDRHAIRLHGLNHPETIHFQEDVFTVPPLHGARGRRLRLLWMSPDCTHFSRAKGGKPRESGRRSLADVVFPWLRDVHPEVVILENVPEFLSWGPLDPSGHPIKARAGEFFREWVVKVESRGYRVEWRTLSACDFGAPTTRRRLYLVARCDGQAFRWPEPTHGPGRAHPWKTAAECIDWSIPCPSIFDRRRPLAEATQRRIAHGLVKYVLNTPRPFLLCLTHGGRLEPLDEPARTITTANRGERALVVPYLVQSGYGERQGQAPRTLDIEAPLGAVVAGGQKHGIVAAWLAKHYTGVTGSDLGHPLGTVTAKDHHALCTARLAPGLGDGARRVAAFLCKYYGTGGQWQGLAEPLHTIPTVDRFGLVTAEIDGEPWVVTDVGMRMLQPRELATAMGFPTDYLLEGSKSQQVARIGNAVCPPVARALVEAMLGGGGSDRTAGIRPVFSRSVAVGAA